MSTLTLNDISVATGDRTLVDGVSLSLQSGEIHVLMGPNGSGKSSLLNALMGHPKYALTKGSITLDDRDITKLPTEEKAKAGLFLSLQHLPEISGVSMTNFLHRAHTEMKGGTMTPLEFYKYAERLAQEAGISAEFLKKQVNSGLSGGEKKQSEVLQLIVLEPKFAFLDEIDSGVDVDAMKHVYASIERLKHTGMGFVLVTHSAYILEHVSVDAVHVMRGGVLIASGGKELAHRIAKEGFTEL